MRILSVAKKVLLHTAYFFFFRPILPQRRLLRIGKTVLI
jgi:hypothetical protein